MFDIYSYLIKSCLSKDEELEKLTKLTNYKNIKRIIKIVQAESIKNIYSNDEFFLLMLRDINNFLAEGFKIQKAVYIARSKKINPRIFYVLEDKKDLFELAKIIRKVERKKSI